MRKEESKPKKQPYVEPKVIATYEKEELEDTLKAHGQNREGSPVLNADLMPE